MEQLSLHIEYLLTRHDCVVVPGFGAFINIFHAPQFNNDTRLLSPPGCEIRFNAAIKEDDGLLAKSIARKNRVSYREASDELNKLIHSLIESLSKEGELTIGRIGIIRKETEGNLCFYPFKTADKYATDLGLISVPFPFFSPKIPSSASSFSSVTIDIDENTSIVSEKRDSELQEEFLFSEDHKKMDYDKNYYIPLNKVFAKVCASLLVCLIFAIFWLRPGIISENKETRASVFPIDKMTDSSIRSDEVGKLNEKTTHAAKKNFDHNSLDTIGKAKIKKNNLKFSQ